MRWYHFGFAFFWALYTTGPFGNAAVAQAAAQMFGEADPSCIFTCGALQQGAAIVSLIVLATLARNREKMGWNFGWLLGCAMVLGLILRWLAPCTGGAELPIAYAGAIIAGLASGAFMMLWQSFFANAGKERAVVYIPLSAVLSVVLSIIIIVLPAIAGVICLAVLLPLAASASLMLCLRETEPYKSESLTPSRLRTLISDMGFAVLCVCIVGFVWKIVVHLNGNAGPLEALAASAGMVIAALLVAGIQLFGNRGFDIMRLFQIIFPVVTGALLPPVLLGAEWMPFLSGCLMCGFEVLNLMLIISCAAYAAENQLKPSQVYVTCVGAALIALLAGDIAGYIAEEYALYDMTIMAGWLFACAYLLVLAMSIVSFALGKRAQSHAANQNASAEGEGDASSSDAASSNRAISNRDALEAAIAELNPVEPVSKRELDVLELYLRGYNAPAAAEKLVISENTVRSHTKSLYRKLGVHSRQELIGLFSS